MARQYSVSTPTGLVFVHDTKKRSHGILGATVDATFQIPVGVGAAQGVGSATGVSIITGTLTQTLDGSTVTATLLFSTSATYAQTFDSDALSATGTVSSGNDGVYNIQLDAMTLSAAADVVVSGDYAATLDDATLVASGAPTIDVSYAATLDDDVLDSRSGFYFGTRLAGSQAIALAGFTANLRSGVPAFPAGLLTQGTRAGALSVADAVDDPGLAALAGQRLKSFKGDFYNRVHAVPHTLALGSLPSGATRQVTLWNAWLKNTVTLLSLATDGSVDTAGLSAGEPIQPLQTVTFSVIIPPTGDAIIDTEILFDFGFLGKAQLEITGRRATLFTSPPDWKNPIEVTLEYRTDIITSRSGQEQRRALRRTPRKTIDFGVTLDGQQQRDFLRLLQTRQNQAVTMADPTRSVALTADSSSTSKTLEVDDVPYWLTPGARIAIMGQTTVVQSIAGSTVTVADENGVTLPAGTVIRPALVGLLGNMSVKNLTDSVNQTKISFAVDPGSEPPNLGKIGTLIHHGREVFPFAPSWGDALSSDFAWPVDTVDYGKGVIETFRPVAFGTMTRTATFLGIDPGDVVAIEQFFNRARGRRGEFYLPTGLSDMVLRTGLSLGDSSLRVAGAEIADNFANDTVYRAICIDLVGGLKLFRSIDSMVSISDELGTDTVIQVATPWQTAIAVEDVVNISWMPVFRMASDSLTIQWLTDSIGRAQIAMVSLPDLEPEAPLLGQDDLALYDGAAVYVYETFGPEGALLFDPLNYLVNVRYPEIAQ